MKMYRLTKKVIFTGREGIIAEAATIGELRKQWEKYQSRWLLYWRISVDPLLPSTRGWIATSQQARIVMSREEII